MRSIPQVLQRCCFALLLTGSVAAMLLCHSSQAQPQNTQDEALLPRPRTDVPIRFNRITVEDGLSNNVVLAIMQDRHGFMWFGTEGGGLNRYDGYTFTVYKPNPFDSTSLGGISISGFYEDREGVLWVISNGGLNRFDAATETFTQFRHDPEDATSLSSEFVFAVTESSDRALWIATFNGLNRMDPDAPGVFTRYLYDPEDGTSLSDNRVLAVTETSDGALWVGTGNGLNRMDPDTPGVFTRYLTGEGLRSRCRFIHEDPTDPTVLWVATGVGLVRFDTRTGQHTRYLPNPLEPDNELLNAIIGVTLDPVDPGVLWAAGLLSGLLLNPVP